MDRRDVVIVGGGLAGATTAEHYRKTGGGGSLALLSADPDLPVNRPPLSKDYLLGETPLDDVVVHPASFYEDNQIELRLDSTVVGLDLAAKQVRLATGEVVGFGTLVLATGARARRLSLAGGTLPGIHYLRSLWSSQRLRRAYEDAREAVVIGAGFIGMEVTSVLTQRGVQCMVLGAEPRVWPRLMPEIVSDFVQSYYQDQGVDVRLGQRVQELRGDNRVRGVVLESGASLPADLVVAGVGAELNTGLAEAAGLAVERGIVVDEYLRSSHPDVYAVGDIASFPDPIAGRIHLEHWDNALDQGRILGTTLAGQRTPFDVVTQFFSNVFDLSLNLVGYPQDWDDIIVRGEHEGGKLTAPPFRIIYIKEGTVRAVLLVNRQGGLDMGELVAWRDLVKVRAPARAQALGDHTVDPRTLLSARPQ